uniref:Nudix hydrolase domain-containing protein n=1 Tax=viral metagenome TaxID=1070528 RepID=A0A6C0LY27_9ZZZZ
MDILDDDNIFRRRSLYCLNCGRKGHIGKKCKDPPTSYGIICFNLVEDYTIYQRILESKYNRFPNATVNNINMFWFNNKNKNIREDVDSIVEILKTKIRFLLIRRKNSLGFIEFMRGRYDTSNNDTIVHLIEQMTHEERQMLIDEPFDNVWVTLWKNTSRNKLYEKEYQLSLQKFQEVDKNIITNTFPKYDIPEWGFPKGRRNYYEKDVECARREFNEETGLDDRDVTILDRIYPISEIFTGTNMVKYKHVYFLGTTSCLKTVKADTSEIQKQEVGDIGWFTYNEAIKRIRPYHTERKKLMDDFLYFLAFNIRYYREHFVT